MFWVVVFGRSGSAVVFLLLLVFLLSSGLPVRGLLQFCRSGSLYVPFRCERFLVRVGLRSILLAIGLV